MNSAPHPPGLQGTTRGVLDVRDFEVIVADAFESLLVAAVIQY